MMYFRILWYTPFAAREGNKGDQKFERSRVFSVGDGCVEEGGVDTRQGAREKGGLGGVSSTRGGQKEWDGMPSRPGHRGT